MVKKNYLSDKKCFSESKEGSIQEVIDFFGLNRFVERLRGLVGDESLYLSDTLREGFTFADEQKKKRRDKEILDNTSIRMRKDKKK